MPSFVRFKVDHHRKLNLNEENNIDPDDGNSRKCNVCTLPIFSTPFVEMLNRAGDDGGKFVMHDQCANIPFKLEGHVLHQLGPLGLAMENQHYNIPLCRKCKKKCGNFFYQCPDIEFSHCAYLLDVLCSLQNIRILHRSHRHRLTVIRGSVSFICGACGTQHDESTQVSYLCHLCDFWIHPHCALLPNAVIPTKHHPHSLLLTYNIHGASDSNFHSEDESEGSSLQAYITCAICSDVIQGSGAYCCLKCQYYAHVNCVTSDHQSFNPVLIRDAKLADLLHFPLANEFTSAIRYIMENTSGGADVIMNHPNELGKLLFQENLHEHPLIFDEDGGHHPPRVCNACVQFISPPFYHCSQCPDFFLHNCCVNLPIRIEHPLHKHPLFLLSKLASSSFFFCKGCERQGNGFAYSCKDCDDFTMDVVCALMPTSITHESHVKTHILSRSDNMSEFQQTCNCCNSSLTGIWYDCKNCRHFKLHACCALLPKSIKHKYDDEHPLELTTKAKESESDDEDDDKVKREEVDRFCEICEKEFEGNKWWYSCGECNESFHIDCISYVDRLSKIKFGVAIHAKSHGSPLTLIREDTVISYRCGVCHEPFNRSDEFPRLAYECSNCYFGIHNKCAQ